MTTLLAVTFALTSTAVPGDLCQRYDPGVMGRVVANRVKWGQLPAGTDPLHCVALVDCSHLGLPVRILWPDDRVSWHLACDCSAEQDRERHQQKGLAVEVPWEVALLYGHQVGRWELPRDGPLPGVRVELVTVGDGRERRAM